MANKLKDIFSNDSPGYSSTLRFQNDDAYRIFRSALETVARDGSAVAVDGIESVSVYLEDHGIRIPINHCDTVSDFMVGPVIDSVPYTVSWGEKEKTYSFKRYIINDGVVLETNKNAVVALKLIFSEDTRKVKITYQIQYEFAKSVDEIVFELNACISFLSIFYAPTAELGNADDVHTMNEILRCLRYTEGFLSRLNAVEQKLGVNFSPQKLNALSSEDHQDIEELYLLLCKKLPLRINAKINASEENKIELSKAQKEVTIGTKIALCFVRKIEYDLLGQQFAVYTANALINAIIKEIQQNGEQTTIYYGDVDSQPMYISHTAFLNEEEAHYETQRNLGGEAAYIEALTGVQYMQAYFERSATK